MSTTLLVIGILFMCGATVVAFRPIVPSSVIAYVGLMLMKWSGYISIGANQLTFLGIATLLVLMIASLGNQRQHSCNYGANGYTAGGALAGTVLGLVISPSMILVGSCVGAILGVAAYSRTPVGRTDGTPILRRLSGDGLPAIVTFYIIGVALSLLITAHQDAGTLIQ